PRYSYAVSDAARKNLEPRTVRLHSPDRRVRITAIADVAWGANLQIQETVRTKRKVLPSVVRIGREPIADDRCLQRRSRGRLLQPLEHAVVPQDAVGLGDVQRAVAKGDAVWHPQAARHGRDALVEHRIDLV